MTSKAANVLVVEDDTPTLQQERLLLEAGGYTVTSASSGEEAIVMVADHSPDLVLLDIGLPGIDGFTTCKVIRKFSQVPIIMVTGSTSSEDKARGLATGADDYITKPFSDDELFSRSTAALSRPTVCVKALQRFHWLCEKISEWVSSPDYRSAASSIKQNSTQMRYRLQRHFRQRNDAASRPVGRPDSLKGLVCGRVAGIAKDPRWSALGNWTKDLLLVACRASYIIAASLASLARETSICVWNSQPMGRVRAAQLTAKSRNAAVQVLKSRFVKKAQWVFPEIRKGVSDYGAAFLSSFGKGPDQPVDAQVVHSKDSEAFSSADLHQSGSVSISPESIEDIQGREAAAPASQLVFLEQLLRAYIKVAETICDDPMVSAPVVPLVSVYEQMALSLREGEYSRQQFAQEVYLAHRSGIDTTPTGAKVQFPISRGVPSKTLVVTDEAGRQVRYYGVRFMQNGGTDLKDFAERRPFEEAEVARYKAEIQEVFRRQLEWPSEEFIEFVASQVHLAAPTRKESRLLAQITRDSLQEFVNNYADFQ